MAERLRKEVLPPPWSYGVTKDGRIFFINDQTRSTTWIHPVRGVPIGTGFTNREDLPPGWQEAITPEGAVYFVDHNEHQTSFHHPFTGRTEVESDDLLLIEPERYTPTSTEQTLSAPLSFNVSAKVSSSPSFRSSPSTQNPVSTPTTPTSPSGAMDKVNFKARRIPKVATPTPKRSQDSTIAMEGWLYKQDSGGLKLWKRRWCVISDFCLFYYKGADEVNKAGSIMLPSYQISPIEPRDKIARKYAFKCEHDNMRTYYFAAENQGQMNRWLAAFQMASMVRMDRTIGPPQNGDSTFIPDEDDAGFSEYRSRSRQNTATRSPTTPSSQNGSLKSPQDGRYPTHQQNGRRPPPQFDDPRYAAPPRPQDRHDSLSSKGSRDQRAPADFDDGYASPSGSGKHKRQKAPSPAKRKLYDEYSSPDEGAGSRYDPSLDPFRDDDTLSPDVVDFDQYAQDSIDSYATPSDDDVFAKKKTPSSHDDHRSPETEKLQKTSAREDHAGYATRKADDRHPQGPKDDYEDMTGGYPDWRNGARPDDYQEMNNLPAGVDVDQQWSTGSESESDSETESYSGEEGDDDEEGDESPEPASPQHIPASTQHVPSSPQDDAPPSPQDAPSSPRNASRSPPKSPPHTPGHYPASYNTLPRRKSRSRSSSTSKEDGQLSPHSNSSERDVARPSSLHIPRKESPRDAEGRPRNMSDPRHPSYQPHQQSPTEAQPYVRSPHDPRGAGSPPSSQRVSSPSSVSSGSQSDRPTQRRDDRYHGPNKPPRDQNEQVFQFPRQPHHREPTSPEQRSFLQSPLVQPSQPVTPEQRIDINSPMTFDGRPQWPQKQHPRDSRQSPQSSKDDGSDRIVPSIQEPVQASSSPWQHIAPPPGLNEEAPQKRVPPPYDIATRSASRDKLSGPVADQADVAPSRRNAKPSPNLKKRDTLERQEIEAGDQFPALDNEGMKLGAPTSRFRKWQQKIQPYITLSTGIRLRLSIAGDELLGKSHEELVLLLIQLRRDQANLQCWLEMLDDELALIRDPDSFQGSPSRMRQRNDQLRLSNPDLTEDQQYYKELKKERDEVETELEISRPLINLVDNLVRMGSLYGGQNELIAQEFYKDRIGTDADFPPPKKLIEFSRRREEELHQRDLEDEWSQVQTAEDRRLEEKLEQLHRQDRKLQEISTQVSLLKEEKDKIESSMERLHREMRRSWEDPDRMMSLEEQQRDLKKELVKVRTQLAKGTKELEEITADNSKIEHEVAVLKSKLQNEKQAIQDPVNGGNATKEKLQMEREVSRVQSLLSNLDQQRELLMSQMQGIRKNGDVSQDSESQDRLDAPPEEFGHYFTTDLDTMETTDMSPSYHRSRANSQTLPGRSQGFSPVGRRPVPPGGEGQSRDAISDRLNVAPPRGQDWRGSGSDIGGRPSSGSRDGRPSSGSRDGRPSSGSRDGRPLSGSRDGRPLSGSRDGRMTQNGRQSLPRDARGNYPYQGRGPGSQDGYQHSPIQPRRADQTQASPAPMDYRGSPGQQRRSMDPRLSPAQRQQHPQYSPAQQRRQGYQSGTQSFPENQREAAINRRNDYVDPQNMNYRQSAPPDRYRQDYDSRGRTDSHDRPSTHSSSMPRNRRDQPKHSDSLNRHPTHPTAQKSSTLPSRKSYTVTDLDTKQSQQISSEMYDRDPPSGSSSSQKSADLADEYFVTPETRPGEESQGNRSYGGPYSTLPGGLEGRDYDSQPGHERYNEPHYVTRSQSLPHHQSQPHPHSPWQTSGKPYLITDLDTKDSRDISQSNFEMPSSNRPHSGSRNTSRQAPPPQQRSDSLRRVREMQGQISPYQDYPQHSSPTNHTQPPPDILSSPIQDGVYFATPSPRHSMSEVRDDRGGHTDGWPQYNDGIGQQPSSTFPHSRSMPNRNEILVDGEEIIPRRRAMDEHMPPESSYHQGDGLNSDHVVLSDSELDGDQRLRDDIDIYDLERALKTQEDEEDEYDVKKVRGSAIIRADYKSVQIDESTGGGLFHSNSVPLTYQLTYQQAKRRWLREQFFSADAQLGMPAKIVIPERYNPLDDSEDETGLSPEELVQRERRVENIQKMLSSHSLQEWHPSEIMPEWGTMGHEEEQDYLKRKVQEEKIMRQEVLAKRRELAAEVKEQTRVIAAQNMRRVGANHEP